MHVPVTSQDQRKCAKNKLNRGFRGIFPALAIILAAAEDHPDLHAYFRITLKGGPHPEDHPAQDYPGVDRRESELPQTLASTWRARSAL